MSTFSCCAQFGKKFELLNCDDHKSLLLKNGRDVSSARPDITHQVRIQVNPFECMLSVPRSCVLHYLCGMFCTMKTKPGHAFRMLVCEAEDYADLLPRGTGLADTSAMLLHSLTVLCLSGCLFCFHSVCLCFWIAL